MSTACRRDKRRGERGGGAFPEPVTERSRVAFYVVRLISKIQLLENTNKKYKQIY